MSAPLVRALVALAILAGSVYFAVTTPARLGLDLRGGTQIVLETQTPPTVKAGQESTDRALEVLRRRVDALGVAEPTLTRSGDRRIIVELPGLQDPREAAEVIGRTAQLTFHPVLGVPEPTRLGVGDRVALAVTDALGVDRGRRGDPAEDEDGQPLASVRPALTGEGVKGAQAAIDSQGGGGWYVTSTSRAAAGPWDQLTGDGGLRSRPATRAAGSRSCSTTRSSPRRRSTPASPATSASPAGRPRSPAGSRPRRPRSSPS